MIGHTTTTSLIGIPDDLKRSMNGGEVSLMVFPDYCKAFDTVYCLEKDAPPGLLWFIFKVDDKLSMKPISFCTN